VEAKIHFNEADGRVEVNLVILSRCHEPGTRHRSSLHMAFTKTYRVCVRTSCISSIVCSYKHQNSCYTSKNDGGKEIEYMTGGEWTTRVVCIEPPLWPDEAIDLLVDEQYCRSRRSKVELEARFNHLSSYTTVSVVYTRLDIYTT
jgi:hypothetical protein